MFIAGVESRFLLISFFDSDAVVSVGKVDLSKNM